jgi:hypothetical protein
MAENDELLGYIKDSVDKLHEKVDTGFITIDTRIKELEIAKAHAAGYKKAAGTFVSIVWGLVGGIASSAATWQIFHPK